MPLEQRYETINQSINQEGSQELSTFQNAVFDEIKTQFPEVKMSAESIDDFIQISGLQENQ